MLNVLIVEPVRIVAEDIAAEVRSVCESAVVHLVDPRSIADVPRPDLLIWGWILDAPELEQRFRALASAARKVIVTAATERLEGDVAADYLPFPVRPATFRDTIRKALSDA